ncbi:hypothetical protein [Bradyrhizobium sp. Gha]|uniref:hypothetical protein n=1 Tax=Bradyrhizobium sp. Gha TaxID=1855318 RepID=UPI0008EA5996|nr:hypothetical protein [Bradyrhizobium sp. Gha]SFJ52419.1 hypothetical protein SAMN05216525_12754 [Bradyrhizobium sp. Gha]
MRLRFLLLVAILVTLSASRAGAPADVSTTLSDIMTKIQLQHAKLWFAGKLSNWGLANYELQQIDSNLEATGRLLADQSRASRTKEQLQAVRQALQSKDIAAFNKAYAPVYGDWEPIIVFLGWATNVSDIKSSPPRA